MKKILSVVMSLVFILVQMVPVLASEVAPTANNALPIMISGHIVSEDANSILVQSYKDDQKVILKVSDSTYIADAVTGAPLMLKDRKGDAIVAYYGPAVTKSLPAQSNAVAIIASIPQDFGVPNYAKVEAVEKGSNAIKVTVNNGSLILTIKDDTVLSPFKTKNIVALGNIHEGTELLFWANAITMSFPGQGTATKVVILGNEAPVAASGSFTVENKTLPTDTSMVKGNLPLFTGTTNKTFYDTINAKVDKIYEDAVKEATDVNFSYDTVTYNNYTSITIHTAAFAGNTSGDTVNTFVLDNKMDKQYMLTDILGVNAYKLANEFISKQIAKAPEGAYFTDTNGFRGIQSEPNFYMDTDGNATIIFDKYSIAPGSSGTPTFSIAVNTVVNKEISMEQTYIKNGICMVPLAAVAEAYGYTVKWDGKTKSVTLMKGEQTHTISIMNNMFDKRQLEAAAEIGKDNKTYVPISYFEVVLGGCYVVSDTAITFSALN